MFDQDVRLQLTPEGTYRMEVYKGSWIPFIDLTDQMIDKLVSERERIQKNKAILEGGSHG